jgi:hypothetical protein
MAFGMTPMSSVYPAPAAEEFPNFLEFRANGEALGGRDADTVDFIGGRVTRGTGDNSGVVTVDLSARQVWADDPRYGTVDKTGAVSSRSALVAADIAAAAAGCALVVPAGIYLIDSSYTFTAPVIMSPGARFKTSSSGVTLDFSAGFDGGMYYCIESAGPVVLDRVAEVFPEWFGAKVGGTDCTDAMSRAHATGRPVHYGRGSYWFTSFSIPNGGIVGGDRERTFLFCTDTSATNAINVTATLPTVFRGFQLGAAGAKVGAVGINVNPGAGLENNGLLIQDCSFISFAQHLLLDRCVYYNVSRCTFKNHTTAAISLSNNTNPDGGDGNITENVFLAGASGFNIIWRSGGGLRVSRNKILNGANAIFINADLPASTSDLFIENNSIENQTGSGITLARASGIGGLTSVSISGNQFAGSLTPVQGGSLPAGFINDLQVINNQFQLIGGNGVTLANVTNPTVSGNQFVAVTGSPTGVNIAASCTGGVVGVNTFRGTFTNKTSVASSTVATIGTSGISTVASAATIALPTDSTVFVISGTTSITSITAFGWIGRSATLIFQGALTLTDGSNLKLGGNFVTTADDAISLTCDGTNWYEVARSAN